MQLGTLMFNLNNSRFIFLLGSFVGPQQYPWLGDAEGTGIVNKDNYIFNGNDPDGGEQNEGAEENRKK